MKTYKDTNNHWISELRVGNVICICEANKRAEARRGVVELAKRRMKK